MSTQPTATVPRPPGLHEDSTAYDQHVERLMREAYDHGNARYVGSEAEKLAEYAADAARYQQGMQRIVDEYGKSKST